ncbi:la-related protein 7-like [Dreissena polymorpha]|uniref:La-related protein 7 n=1 Tax=Dreissena polymorpha TaxID=45954 RepID=A0A9D4M457_DREPO|nr:la-related protein 7-like [Dreissena polymorpha]XP_052265709.1 la-related protein 7-like [Dreissena polymorpha]KAH3869873.1 hypothetical protein DPMN_033046 [Dreissena polymorpha]
MEQESMDSKPMKTKKKRQRMKSVYSNIRNQMEFYFSDANLRKDRFLKKAIDATSDGYIALETFLTFNKIKTLTEEVHVLAEAIHNKSQMLQVNAEKTHVKRTTPIQCDVNVDDRTVYVECLPHNVDHEWVRKVFSACGKVAYVSLPRYNSTGDLKGFAFIEFETTEGAEMACKELNNPPADFVHRVGMFPKSSHQLDALKKKLPADQVKETEEKAKELLETGEKLIDEDADKVEKKDATEVTTESNNEKKEVDATEQGTKSAKSKRRRTASETECTSSPAKRKKSAEVSFNLPEKDSEDENKTTPLGKKKGKKRRNRSRASEDNDSSKDESGVEKSDTEVPAKKARVTESVVQGGEEESRVVEKSGQEKKDSAEINSKNKENKSQKKRFRRKHTKDDKEVPELRVIPKTEWLKLRSEYLKLQKTSMAMLKKSLRNTQPNEMQTEDKSAPSKHKHMEFVADVIVKVHSEAPLHRQQLKENLGGDVKVAYIDIVEDSSDGFIRCKDAESAKAIADKKLEGLTFTLVSGEDEKQYWDKLEADRESKLSKKGRHKKRGHQKWMEKAQKASIENWERKHVVFDDE